MLTYFLCITCSDHCVDLCRFTGSFSDRIIESCISFTPRHPVTADSLAADIANAVEKNDLFSHTYYVALNSRFVMLRNWSFPFTSKSKIEQALNFELEQELPFSPKDIITGIHLASKTPNGRQVVSVSIPTNFLEAFLTGLQARNIDPERIEIDAFAISNALSSSEINEPSLLLDVDATRSLFAFIQNKQVVTLSQIPHGLSQIKQRVMQAQSLTENSVAQQLLITNVAPSTKDSSPNISFQGALRDSLVQFTKYILSGMKNSNATYERILLSGEITELIGIDEFLSEQLGYPVTSLCKYTHALTYDSSEDTNPINCIQAHGLMKCSAPKFFIRKQGINFRKEQFAFRRKADPVLSVVKHVAIAIIILLLAWSSSLYAEGKHKEKEVEALTLNLTKTFHSALPDVQGVFSPIQYTSILQNRLQQLKGKTAHSMHSQTDIIDVLNELHQHTASHLAVKLDTIAINTKRINLRGTTDNLKTLEQFRHGLSQSSLLKRIEIREATLTPDEQIQFELNIAMER